MAVVAVTSVVLVLFAACGSDNDKAKRAEAPSVYFGWLLGTKEPTGIAIAADERSSDGKRTVRVYVCDGLGPPAGQAVWFKGSADARLTNDGGRTETLVSAGKRERLDIDQFDERLIKGTFTDPAGRRAQYVAYPARDGAGIYEVTLDEELRYSGVSTDGSKVVAQADRDGLVTGKLTPAEGGEIPFAIRTLALAPPAELSVRGLSTSYRKDAKNSLVPGEYVAVIAPSGTHWLGRAGNVRLGSPGAEVIGLDKKEVTSLSRSAIQLRDVNRLAP